MMRANDAGCDTLTTTMSARILHILSQRPGQTGSGVILEMLVRHAAAAGYDQRVIVGVPEADGRPPVGGLADEAVVPLYFERAPLDFPVPGMSDVMPYRSSVWSQLSEDQLTRYRRAWRDHVAEVVRIYRPDLIHAHHIWLMSSMLRDIVADTPMVLQCHGTGLRQMELCEHLSGEVRRGCAAADRFVVLREDHADLLSRQLEVERKHIHVVPGGFNEDIFHSGGRELHRAGFERETRSLIYVGKYSAAKGLPQLLDALADLSDVALHVAGDGAGPEAEELRERMRSMATVTMHGQLDQPELARLMRRCEVCVLPSYYEGVPLVLVEAAACGCRVVATALPGVSSQLAPKLGAALTMVDPPAMAGIDTPEPEALGPFTQRLTVALQYALDTPAPSPDLQAFGWRRVFDQVETVWKHALSDPH